MVALLLTLLPSLGVASTNHAWTTRYGGLGDDEPYDAAVSSDGSAVYVTGWSEPYLEGSTGRSTTDWVTARFDSETGEMLWSADFDGPASEDDHAYAVAPTPDGATVLVAGAVGTAGGSDATLVAYDAATGMLRWLRTVSGGSDDTPDIFDGLVVAQDGQSVIVVGSIGRPPSSKWRPPLDWLDMYVAKVDVQTGETAWQSTFDGSGSDLDHATGLELSPDGTKVAVIGQSLGASGRMNALTMLLRVSDGHINWIHETDIGHYDVPLSARFTPGGDGLFVAGTADSGTGQGSFVESFEVASGTSIWMREVPSRSYHENVLALSPDGTELYVAGGRLDARPAGWRITALDALEGETRWTVALGEYGSAVDIDRLPDGTVVVAGTFAEDLSGRSFDFVTLGLSPADGAILWRGSFDGDLASDHAAALTVTTDGRRSFTVGRSWNRATTSFDYAIVGHGPGCTDGSREEGPLSRPLDVYAEPHAPAVHTVNCEAAIPAGL